MDTVSLLVDRHTRAGRHILFLVALASIGLGLLAVGDPGPVLPSLRPAAEPLLSPFRWHMIAANLA